MLEWELRDPWFLAAAFAAPFVYWFAARMPAAVTFSSLALVDQAPRSLRAFMTKLPALFLALATVSMAIAMAGPRAGDSTTKVKREGIAICMVVDTSGSMQALDLALGEEETTRLDAVKEVFREFVLGNDKRPGRIDDLIGIVAFATYADGLCPLTLDHPNMLEILAQLRIPEGEESNATAIGEGLALGVERLRLHPARSKIIVLLTDGVSNAGEITPMQAAELAVAHNIKVYTIGAGTNGMAPVRVKDRRGREVLRSMRVEIDEETLQEIAYRTDGRYYRATDGEALREIVTEIDRLERSEIVDLRYLNYSEKYVPFVLGSGVLIALAALLSATALRRLP